MEISEEYKREHGFTPELVADTMMDFYGRIDAATAKIQEALSANGLKLHCRPGCCHCCRDGLTMTQAEASVIHRLFPKIGLESPHAPGACAFLDDNCLCRIYAARPYICRTHGLPLDIELTHEEAIESGLIDPGTPDNGNTYVIQDICEINQETIDPYSLPEDCYWSSAIAERQLAAIELCTFGDSKRIPMRSFFEEPKGTHA